MEVRVALAEVRVSIVLLLDALALARLSMASRAPTSSLMAWSKRDSMFSAPWARSTLLAWHPAEEVVVKAWDNLKS